MENPEPAPYRRPTSDEARQRFFDFFNGCAVVASLGGVLFYGGHAVYDKISSNTLTEEYRQTSAYEDRVRVYGEIIEKSNHIEHDLTYGGLMLLVGIGPGIRAGLRYEERKAKRQ